MIHTDYMLIVNVLLTDFFFIYKVYPSSHVYICVTFSDICGKLLVFLLYQILLHLKLGGMPRTLSDPLSSSTLFLSPQRSFLPSTYPFCTISYIVLLLMHKITFHIVKHNRQACFLSQLTHLAFSS